MFTQTNTDNTKLKHSQTHKERIIAQVRFPFLLDSWSWTSAFMDLLILCFKFRKSFCHNAIALNRTAFRGSLRLHLLERTGTRTNQTRSKHSSHGFRCDSSHYLMLGWNFLTEN